MHMSLVCKDDVWCIRKAASMDLLQARVLHFSLLCKMDYKVDTFMHAPSYSYNEVMQVLKLAAVIRPRANVGEKKNV